MRNLTEIGRRGDGDYAESLDGSTETHDELMSKCDTAVRTQYVLHVTSPVSLLTQTSFHHTFCTVHTVYPVCSPLTLVVNITLTTITHHIISSVLAEPQYIY